MDFLKVVPIIISTIALVVAMSNSRRTKKLDRNSMIRLTIACKTLEKDFQTLRFNHSILHLIPGEIIDENNKEGLVGSFKKIETKLDLIYDLILINTEIYYKDIREIVENLETITLQLEELKYLRIEDQGDMDVAKSILNPIEKRIEIIQRILSEYDMGKS